MEKYELNNIFFSEYEKNYIKKEREGKDNDFTNFIQFCKSKGRKFVDTLLSYESMDENILFCYLNIAMTSTATVKKLSDAATIFEEAFAALVIENNFDRWIYLSARSSYFRQDRSYKNPTINS